MNPFFSIIIPTFNSGNCIKGALQSVCQQRFTNYEIIIVDGLSTDDTLEKVNVFYNKYGSERIIVKSEKDDGIYDAMNKDYMARGEFVYFMGSDDVYLVIWS